jgi:hypothetical protein
MWFIVGELKPIPIRQEHTRKDPETPTPSVPSAGQRL